jgi:hypothetical protein
VIRTRIRSVRGESRDTVLSHEAPHTSVQLVKVGTGGVDRQTGEPIRTYWEMTAKLPRQPEHTYTTSHERNAYLMAQHGIVDLSTPLEDIGERQWHEPRNMTPLAGLAPRDVPRSPVWTRMDSGDSAPDLDFRLDTAPWTRPDRPGLFREVPIAELEAEEVPR